MRQTIHRHNEYVNETYFEDVMTLRFEDWIYWCVDFGISIPKTTIGWRLLNVLDHPRS